MTYILFFKDYALGDIQLLVYGVRLCNVILGEMFQGTRKSMLFSVDGRETKEVACRDDIILTETGENIPTVDEPINI